MLLTEHPIWETYREALVRLARASQGVADCSEEHDLLAAEAEFSAAMMAYNAARRSLADAVRLTEPAVEVRVIRPTHMSGRTLHEPSR